MILIETFVSFGDDERVDIAQENASSPSQAISGVGCRLTRLWVHKRLRALFPYVYMPKTQPWHTEFPIDLTTPGNPGELTRSSSGLQRVRGVARR